MMPKPTIIAVDLSAIYYQAYHVTANDQISVSEQYRKTMVATLSKINHIRTLDMGVAAPHVVICCDDKRNWRKDIDPSYKAQREKQDAGFYGCLERTKERLAADGLPVLQVPGYEADDVIASLVRASIEANLGVIVASPDKDLLQLVQDSDPGVRQLRTHKMFLDDNVTVKLYNEEMVKAEFGILPNRFADYLALIGDKSDNIEGIPGVGGTAAPKILSAFGSLQGLISSYEAEVAPGLDEYPTLSRCKSALVKYFGDANAVDKLSKNRILVGLKHDVPIDMEDILRERKAEKLSTPEPEEQVAMDAVFIGAEETEKKHQDTPKPAPVGTQAIATRSVAMTQFDADMNPMGMEAMYWLAKRACDSRNYIKKFSNEDACLMAIMNGRRFGLSPVAALETLYVIEGKVCLPAQFMVTLARRNPDCEYFDVIESDDKHCIVETKRRSDGKVFRVDFNIAEAVTAGLVKPNSNWTKWPIDMCYARACSRLGRRVWTDALHGAYSIEEMADAQ